MKQTRTFLFHLFSLVFFSTASLHAADEPRLATLRAADDERAAAMRSGDRARLEAIFANELRYCHSSGAVDTKASFIESLASGRTRYLALDYQERNFTFPAPGIALMTGRVNAKIQNAGGTNDLLLSFLAVWHEENGHWRFLAWQSARLNPPAAPK